MAQIVSDDFNRANGTLGANWTVIAAGADIGLDIVSNQCKASAATGESIAWFSGGGWTGGNDQYAEAKIVAIEASKDAAVVVRASGASIAVANAYFIDLNSLDSATPGLGGTVTISFYKQVAGSFTQLGTDFTTTISANDVVRLEVTGSGASTVLVAKVNGTQVGTVTDSAGSHVASGNPGLYVGSGTGCIWDDFAAGDFSGAFVPYQPNYFLAPAGGY